MSGDTLDELIRRLPELLRERPDLAEKLYAALKDRFVTNEVLKEYMEQAERRFEASDKRFEDLLTQMDSRFEVLDQQWEELRAASDRRWEALNQRWEELRAASDQRFENLITRMDRQFEAAQKHREYLEQKILETQAGVGALGRRSGIALERTILSLFRRALELRGIDVEKVEKIGIRDERGDLFRTGAKVEYDLYIHNGEHFLFEIKYHVAEEDIDVFLKKVEFFEQTKQVSAQKVVIALEIDEYVRRICEDHDIEVITS